MTRPHADPDPTRAEHLTRAIIAAITGDVSQVDALFTPDVVGSGPVVSVTSRDELTVDIGTRGATFTDIEVACAPLAVAGGQACVEWVASAVHSGPLVLDEHRPAMVEPSGRRVRVRAVTVAEFEGGRISSFRSYWDDLPKLQDLRDAGRS